MPKDITLNLDKRSAELRDGLYNALERAVIDSLNEASSNGLVVDIGAGRGEMLQRLAAHNFSLLGIDPEEECVAMASSYGRCQQGGIEDLQKLLGDEKPEVIICSHVLEHLDSPFDAIRKMHQSGATELILAVPNVLRSARLLRAFLGRRSGDHPEHVYAWGHAEFAALVNRAGYVPIEWYIDRVTINPLANRLGGFLTSALKTLEEQTLARLHPTLSSSLILRCRRIDPAR